MRSRDLSYLPIILLEVAAFVHPLSARIFFVSNESPLSNMQNFLSLVGLNFLCSNESPFIVCSLDAVSGLIPFGNYTSRCGFRWLFAQCARFSLIIFQRSYLCAVSRWLHPVLNSCIKSVRNSIFTLPFSFLNIPFLTEHNFSIPERVTVNVSLPIPTFTWL
jgi:hypothetical protein